MTAMATIPFIDLAAQRRRLGGAIEAAVLRVMDHGVYIMGPEVRQLEEELVTFCAAAEAAIWVGATPVFVDVLPDSFNMNSASLQVAVATARTLGLRPTV